VGGAGDHVRAGGQMNRRHVRCSWVGSPAIG
jgi:hypothetical protein